MCKAIIAAQRDHGNREVRPNARMKYLVHNLGIDKFRELVEVRQYNTIVFNDRVAVTHIHFCRATSASQWLPRYRPYLGSTLISWAGTSRVTDISSWGSTWSRAESETTPHRWLPLVADPVFHQLIYISHIHIRIEKAPQVKSALKAIVQQFNLTMVCARCTLALTYSVN